MLMETVRSVPRNKNCYKTHQPYKCSRSFLSASKSAEQSKDHAPMKPQMNTYQHKFPIGCRQMQGSRCCHRSLDRKSRKDMTGHHNSAKPQTQHGDKNADIDDHLHYPQQCIFSFEQTPIPPDVQNVMQQKQYEHFCSKPLMKFLPGNLIGH